jgi:serine/threonine protein kinase
VRLPPDRPRRRLDSTDAPIALPQIGQRIDNRYVIAGVLGRGGFGVVYEARDERTGGVVALKVLDLSRRSGPSVLARFRREVDLVASLRHPNTVRITDRGETPEGAPYYAMERLMGESVAALLEREGPLPLERTVDILTQTLRSLSEAHATNIVHRDIKPANLFVTPTGPRSLHVTVLDFGIARSIADDAASITESREVPCSPHYVAPERIVSHAATPASDVYSLGHVAIELLDGLPAFRAPTSMGLLLLHADMELEVPLGEISATSPIAAILERAVAKDASSRFADAGAMLLALEAALGAPDEVLGTLRPDRGDTQTFGFTRDATHEQPRAAIQPARRSAEAVAETESALFQVGRREDPAVSELLGESVSEPLRQHTRRRWALAVAALSVAGVIVAFAATRRAPGDIAASSAEPNAPQMSAQPAAAEPSTAPSVSSADEVMAAEPSGLAPEVPEAPGAPEAQPHEPTVAVDPTLPAAQIDTSAIDERERHVRSEPERQPQDPEPPDATIAAPPSRRDDRPPVDADPEAAPDPQPTETPTQTEWGLGLTPR